jgi:predicted nuclease with TOPRIM domain
VKQNQSIQTSSQQIPELQALNAKTEAKLEAATKRVQSLETQNDALETKARKFETQYEKMVSLYNETLQKCALNEAEIEELKGDLPFEKKKKTKTKTKTKIHSLVLEFKQRAKVELEERSAAVAAPPPSDWSPKFMYVGFVLLIGFIGYQKLKRSST